MERALARLEHRHPSPPHSAERAAVRHAPGSIVIQHSLGPLAHLERQLMLRRDLLPHVMKLSEPQRSALMLRYGLGGHAPQTVAAIARRLKLKSISIARALQRAQRELRTLARLT